MSAPTYYLFLYVDGSRSQEEHFNQEDLEEVNMGSLTLIRYDPQTGLFQSAGVEQEPDGAYSIVAWSKV